MKNFLFILILMAFAGPIFAQVGQPVSVTNKVVTVYVEPAGTSTYTPTPTKTFTPVFTYTITNTATITYTPTVTATATIQQAFIYVRASTTSVPTPTDDGYGISPMANGSGQLLEFPLGPRSGRQNFTTGVSGSGSVTFISASPGVYNDILWFEVSNISNSVAPFGEITNGTLLIPFTLEESTISDSPQVLYLGVPGGYEEIVPNTPWVLNTAGTVSICGQYQSNAN